MFKCKVCGQVWWVYHASNRSGGLGGMIVQRERVA